MDFIADILLAAGAIGAGVYCFILGRRLNRFNDLEKGIGGAVAVLSAQVDELNKSLNAAQKTASISAQTLTDLTKRAESISRQLELQMASLHDLPAEAPPELAVKAANPEPPKPLKPATPMFARRTPVTTTGDTA
ncbi:MAG: hypothetical protein WBG95_16860 [Sulfitobacter sp.]